MSLQITSYTLLLVAALHIPLVRSVFLYSGKQQLRINKSESYTISLDNFEIVQTKSGRYKRPPGIGNNLFSYRNISRIYNADERCEKGLPLSMALLQFSPYVYDHLTSRWIPPRNVTINGTTRKVPGGMKSEWTFYGLFPEILKKAIPTCCHRKSDIRFGKLLIEQSVPAEVDPAHDYDFSFPLYGESMQDTMYRSNPFIPVIQAPRVALLVLSDDDMNGKTHFLATTIFKAWPMFLFILLIASSAGIIMWCLDRSKNEEQFPKPFVEGAWNGLWWAFITMTTVGYGDRSPKSFLGRFFCILWIIFGVVIISVLSGLITAALSASTKIHFKIHGAKIGAVAGSKEFKFGLSLNADMKGFKSSTRAFAELQYKKSINGMLIDNYIANAFGQVMIEYQIRIDRMMDHPITYGIRMAQGSEKLENCLRKYLRDHPQEVFDMFSKNMNPVKNPKDRENLQKKEAMKLFYQDETMNRMLVYGACFVVSILVVGLCIQQRRDIVSVFQEITNCTLHRREPRTKSTHRVVSDTKWGLGSLQEINSPLKELLDQYNCFQQDWVKKMKDLHQE